MTEEIISFETAKLAKEAGFVLEQSIVYFDTGRLRGGLRKGAKDRWLHGNGQLLSDWMQKDYVGAKEFYEAPTQSLLQRWLREVHKFHIYIDTTASFDELQGSKWKAVVKVPFQPFKWTTAYYYLGDTYEEALEKGLVEALKLVNEKQKDK